MHVCVGILHVMITVDSPIHVNCVCCIDDSSLIEFDIRNQCLCVVVQLVGEDPSLSNYLYSVLLLFNQNIYNLQYPISHP